MSNFSYAVFNQLGVVVEHIHMQQYRGKNKASRYKIAAGVIAVVENNCLNKIIDFNKRRIIKINPETKTTHLWLLTQESTLAEDVIEHMTPAIKKTSNVNMLALYEAADMLPTKWLSSKLDQIYKYSGRNINIADKQTV